MFLDKKNFLSPKISDNETVVVDYIGTCVWKPLHIGHMCTPNIGQTMINIYNKLWYNIISDSHIWDWWIIFWKLITAYKLWWDKSRLSENAVDYLLELYVKITAEVKENPELDQKTRDEFKLLS
jgi:arginyl-tRNA synthetase